jgi:hypothetical protein
MLDQFVETYLGIHTADAEQIELSFANGTLLVRYVDWQEQRREQALPETLAFRWQEYDDNAPPRDDTTYEVRQSAWLEAQVHGIPNNDRFRHYKLCFNACGVLDVLCQEVVVSE